MTADRDSIIQYRLERARLSLDEARSMAENRLWYGCVNRLYYACFYAVFALLASEDLSGKRHTGVLSLFNRHFVRSGRIPFEEARVFNVLFEERQDSDYGDFASIDPGAARVWLDQTQGLVDLIARLLHASQASEG